MNRFTPCLAPRAQAAPFAFALLALLLCSSQTASAQDAPQRGPEEMQAVEQAMNQYVGTYGGRVISYSDGSIMFTNDRMPMPVSLKEIGEDSFEVIIPPGAMVRGPAAGGGIPTFLFNRNEDGDVVSLSMVDTEGTVMSTYDREE